MREVEHPAVVCIAAAKRQAVAAGEDADCVGGDQGEDGIERPAVVGARERGARSRRAQLWHGARDGRVDVPERGSGRPGAGQGAAEELVEVLPQCPDSLEVVLARGPARGEANAGDPVAEALERVEALDRSTEATADCRNQVERKAAGVEAKRADKTGDGITADCDRCKRTRPLPTV